MRAASTNATMAPSRAVRSRAAPLTRRFLRAMSTLRARTMARHGSEDALHLAFDRRTERPAVPAFSPEWSAPRLARVRERVRLQACSAVSEVTPDAEDARGSQLGGRLRGAARASGALGHTLGKDARIDRNQPFETVTPPDARSR